MEQSDKARIQDLEKLLEMTRNDRDKLDDANIDQENRQIKDLRSYLAISIAKECKCENVNAVNTDMLRRNLELKAILKDLITTKVDAETWRYEMYSTILEVIGGGDE